MRIQTGQIVSLGYGRYVRSDEVVAIEPITEERGPGRRCLVWVRGVADPIVASRSQTAIIRDLVTPTEPVRGGMFTTGRAAPERKPARRRAAADARARKPATRKRRK